MATNNPNQEDLEDVIRNATLLAGAYVKAHAFDYGEIEWKEKDDPVTACDKEAERILRSEIGRDCNAHFVGEEFGIDSNDSDITVYIDPIDGTKSFSRGEFLSSVCVAAADKGELFTGYVYDFMRDILYFANKEGAFLEHQGKRLTLPLDRKFALSKKTFTLGHDLYSQLMNKVTNINLRKQIASVGLSMAQLAAGAYECLIMPPHRKNGETDVCDLAAGYFILKKAGFILQDISFKEFAYQKPEKGLIAYSPELEITQYLDVKILEPYQHIRIEFKIEFEPFKASGTSSLTRSCNVGLYSDTKRLNASRKISAARGTFSLKKDTLAKLSCTNPKKANSFSALGYAYSRLRFASLIVFSSISSAERPFHEFPGCSMSLYASCSESKII